MFLVFNKYTKRRSLIHRLLCSHQNSFAAHGTASVPTWRRSPSYLLYLLVCFKMCLQGFVPLVLFSYQLREQKATGGYCTLGTKWDKGRGDGSGRWGWGEVQSLLLMSFVSSGNFRPLRRRVLVSDWVALCYSVLLFWLKHTASSFPPAQAAFKVNQTRLLGFYISQVPTWGT